MTEPCYAELDSASTTSCHSDESQNLALGMRLRVEPATT